MWDFERAVYASTLLLVFILPWRNLLHLGDAFGTVGRVLGLFIAAVWGLHVLWHRRVRIHVLFTVIAGGFFLWSLMSVLWSADSAAAYGDISRYLMLVGMAVILIDVYDSEQRVRLGLQSFVVGAYIGVFVLLWAFVGAGGFDSNIRRLTAPGYNPNRLGGLLAITIPISIYLLYHGGEHTRWLTVVNGVFIPLAGFSVFLTGSRQAMVALVPSVCLLVYVVGRSTSSRGRYSLGLSVLGAFIALLFVLPSRLVRRIYSIPDEILSGELGGRGGELRSALDVIADNLLLGVGAGNRVYSPHNTFARVGMELGLIGLLLLGGLLTLAAIAVFDRRGDRAPLLAVGAVWVLVSLTNHWNIHATTWFLLAMFVALDPTLGDRSRCLPIRSLRITALGVPTGWHPRKLVHE